MLVIAHDTEYTVGGVVRLVGLVTGLYPQQGIIHAVLQGHCVGAVGKSVEQGQGAVGVALSKAVSNQERLRIDVPGVARHENSHDNC